METGIAVFRSVVNYRSYHLTKLSAYINPDADLSLHKVKCKVDLLYITFEKFSGKDPMEVLGIL